MCSMSEEIVLRLTCRSAAIPGWAGSHQHLGLARCHPRRQAGPAPHPVAGGLEHRVHRLPVEPPGRRESEATTPLCLSCCADPAMVINDLAEASACRTPGRTYRQRQAGSRKSAKIAVAVSG